MGWSLAHSCHPLASPLISMMSKSSTSNWPLSSWSFAFASGFLRTVFSYPHFASSSPPTRNLIDGFLSPSRSQRSFTSETKTCNTKFTPSKMLNLTSSQLFALDHMQSPHSWEANIRLTFSFSFSLSFFTKLCTIIKEFANLITHDLTMSPFDVYFLNSQYLIMCVTASIDMKVVKDLS